MAVWYPDIQLYIRLWLQLFIARLLALMCRPPCLPTSIARMPLIPRPYHLLSGVQVQFSIFIRA